MKNVKRILAVCLMVGLLFAVVYTPASAVAVYDGYIYLSSGTDPESVFPEPICDFTVYLVYMASAQEGCIYYFHLPFNSRNSAEAKELLYQRCVPENGVKEVLRLDNDLLCGDVDQNGEINAADALLCLQMAVGKYLPANLIQYNNAFASNSTSGRERLPNAVCALRILQKAVGVE